MKPSPAVRRGNIQTVENPVSAPKPQVYTPIPCYNSFPAVLKKQSKFPPAPDAGTAKSYAGRLYRLIAPASDRAVLMNRWMHFA